MRPRRLAPEVAANLLRIFSAIHAVEKQKNLANGYYFNQYDAAYCLIELAWGAWTNDGRVGVSNPEDMAKLAVDWQLSTEELYELSRFILSLSPEALVQQVKRWRTRFNRKAASA
jgi:hypothetical protein